MKRLRRKKCRKVSISGPVALGRLLRIVPNEALQCFFQYTPRLIITICDARDADIPEQQCLCNDLNPYPSRICSVRRIKIGDKLYIFAQR